MPQSLASLHVHVIFSTKNRSPLIDGGFQSCLYEYIGGTLRAQNCRLLIAGGVSDHVHLLISLARDVSVADVVRSVKANSSRWVHETVPRVAEFAWQSGYGAFSVSQSNVEDVTRYIAHQADHHRRGTFQEEFRAFLERHGIAFDERYAWD